MIYALLFHFITQDATIYVNRGKNAFKTSPNIFPLKHRKITAAAINS